MAIVTTGDLSWLEAVVPSTAAALLLLLALPEDPRAGVSRLEPRESAERVQEGASTQIEVATVEGAPLAIREGDQSLICTLSRASPIGVSCSRDLASCLEAPPRKLAEAKADVKGQCGRTGPTALLGAGLLLGIGLPPGVIAAERVDLYFADGSMVSLEGTPEAAQLLPLARRCLAQFRSWRRDELGVAPRARVPRGRFPSIWQALDDNDKQVFETRPTRPEDFGDQIAAAITASTSLALRCLQAPSLGAVAPPRMPCFVGAEAFWIVRRRRRSTTRNRLKGVYERATTPASSIRRHLRRGCDRGLEALREAGPASGLRARGSIARRAEDALARREPAGASAWAESEHTQKTAATGMAEPKRVNARARLRIIRPVRGRMHGQR